MISKFNKQTPIGSDFGNSLRDNFLQEQITNELGSALETEKIDSKTFLKLISKNGNVLSQIDLQQTGGQGIVIFDNASDMDAFLNESNLGKVCLYIGDTTLDFRYIQNNIYVVLEE